VTERIAADSAAASSHSIILPVVSFMLVVHRRPVHALLILRLSRNDYIPSTSTSTKSPPSATDD